MTILTVAERLEAELDEAEAKAWESLARYKFQMYGYWVGVWVHLNRIAGGKRPNPWRGLVDIARRQKRETSDCDIARDVILSATS
jgi:hypothetical protein